MGRMDTPLATAKGGAGHTLPVDAGVHVVVGAVISGHVLLQDQCETPGQDCAANLQQLLARLEHDGFCRANLARQLRVFPGGRERWFGNGRVGQFIGDALDIVECPRRKGARSRQLAPFGQRAEGPLVHQGGHQRWLGHGPAHMRQGRIADLVQNLQIRICRWEHRKPPAMAPGQLHQHRQQFLRVAGEIRCLDKFDAMARVPRRGIGVFADHDHRNALLAQ